MISKTERDTLRDQIAVIDPAKWRAEFDELGDLVIWFHADLAAEGRRIIISTTQPPSTNELAVTALLVTAREQLTALLDALDQREAELAQLKVATHPSAPDTL